MPSQSPLVEMNNGLKIPCVGFGTALSCESECELAISTAIDTGYRLIDTAALYQNEEVIGRVLNERFLSTDLKREEIFITTKLWNTNHQVEKIRPACEESLKKLGLSFVDLYLIHWPVSFQPCDVFTEDFFAPQPPDFTPLEDTWREMEKLVDAGLTRSIGLSNFNKSQIERILKICRIKPAMLQIEISVNFLNKKLVEFAKSSGIAVTAYAPMGSPGLMSSAPKLLSESFLSEIANKHNKTPAQILLRHLLQLGICIIPKSNHPDRIKSNFLIFDFHLTDEEMEILNTKGRQVRLFYPENWRSHPEFPFDEEY